MATPAEAPPDARVRSSQELVPIGTVVAYAGGMDREWLQSQGWLYCDGTSVPKKQYLDLFLAIGSNYGGTRDEFNLPDLRGRFPRGVDSGAGHDRYADERPPSAPGGLAGDQPGSVFDDRTRRPDQRPLIADDDGEHSHPVPHVPTDKNAVAVVGNHYSIWRDDSTTTGAAGSHTHEITAGGNAETRPLNKAVFFIIKYTDATPEDDR